MKKYIIVLFVFLVGMAFSVADNFDDGYEDGWCAGYQDEEACGEFTICPIAPIAPIPGINQSSNSYMDGYGEGFKDGFRQGSRDCNN